MAREETWQERLARLARNARRRQQRQEKRSIEEGISLGADRSFYQDINRGPKSPRSSRDAASNPRPRTKAGQDAIDRATAQFYGEGFSEESNRAGIPGSNEDNARYEPQNRPHLRAEMPNEPRAAKVTRRLLERGGPAGELRTPEASTAAPAPKPAPAPNTTASPRIVPSIPGGGIAARTPRAYTGSAVSWTPDPNMVLVLGAGLMVLTALTGRGGLQSITDLIWNKNGLNTSILPFTKTALAEALFILILYILANLSDELARIVVVFELGLYLIWLISNPQAVSSLANAVNSLTGK